MVTDHVPSKVVSAIASCATNVMVKIATTIVFRDASGLSGCGGDLGLWPDGSSWPAVGYSRKTGRGGGSRSSGSPQTRSTGGGRCRGDRAHLPGPSLRRTVHAP